LICGLPDDDDEGLKHVEDVIVKILFRQKLRAD
jgi:hypothetical protein